MPKRRRSYKIKGYKPTKRRRFSKGKFKSYSKYIKRSKYRTDKKVQKSYETKVNISIPNPAIPAVMSMSSAQGTFTPIIHTALTNVITIGNNPGQRIGASIFLRYVIISFSARMNDQNYLYHPIRIVVVKAKKDPGSPNLYFDQDILGPVDGMGYKFCQPKRGNPPIFKSRLWNHFKQNPYLQYPYLSIPPAETTRPMLESVYKLKIRVMKKVSLTASNKFEDTDYWVTLLYPNFTSNNSVFIRGTAPTLRSDWKCTFNDL